MKKTAPALTPKKQIKFPTRHLMTNYQTFAYHQWYVKFCIEMWTDNERGVFDDNLLPYYGERYFIHLKNAGNIYGVGTGKNGLFRIMQGKELVPFTTADLTK